VANSRALWEAFLQALAANPDLLAADHPLEEYLEAAVGAALAAAAPGRPARLYWSHRRAADLEPPPGGGAASEHVALQRMAHHSGLAFLDHGSHLCLHPRYGPWFSLRCAIILDDTPYRAVCGGGGRGVFGGGGHGAPSAANWASHAMAGLGSGWLAFEAADWSNAPPPPPHLPRSPSPWSCPTLCPPPRSGTCR
jgi:hypothetical protein